MRRAFIVLIILLGSIIVHQPAGGSSGGEAALTGMSQVSTGYYNGCAKVAGGQARCWGDNIEGQLGDGTNDDSPVAVTVLAPSGPGALTGVAQVVVGDTHACARVTGGQVRCWGRNSEGQLGDDQAEEDSNRPVTVLNTAGTSPLTGVTQLGAGSDHTCARLTTGQVQCWGDNEYGQLGDGTFDNEGLLPVTVLNPAGNGPLTGVTQVDGGDDHTCVRLNTGQARCWGYNDYGGLGDGTTDERHLPVVVKRVSGPGALADVVQVSAGYYHSCARLSNGQARCWGYNADGELGDASTTQRLRPVAVRATTGAGNLTAVISIAAARYHSCAVVDVGSGEARCWGEQEDGLLANGSLTTANRLRPIVVKSTSGAGRLTGVTQVAAHASHTCARLSSGQGRCWGVGDFGQLGDGDLDNDALPVAISS